MKQSLSTKHFDSLANIATKSDAAVVAAFATQQQQAASSKEN